MSSRAGFPMRFGGRAKGAESSVRRNGSGELKSFRLGSQVKTGSLSPVSQAGGALSGVKLRSQSTRSFPFPVPPPLGQLMNVFELTRALIDIESITDNEERVGQYLYDYLSPLAARYGGASSGSRWSRGASTSSRSGASRWSSRSPPTWIPCRRSSPRARTTSTSGDAARATPRASSPRMIKAVEALLEAGERGFGLLFVVGEERNSAGAYHAAQIAARVALHHQRRADREPARARIEGRAALRGRAPRARWRTRRIPELGDSAIHKLIDALAAIRRIPLPVDALLGPEHAEHRHALRRPRAQRDRRRGAAPRSWSGWWAIRPRPRRRSRDAVDGLRGAARSDRDSGAPAGRASTASRPRWSRTPPISRRSAARGASRSSSGPGTIHVAHTLEERVPKQQLLEAVEIYQRMVRQLCKRESK